MGQAAGSHVGVPASYSPGCLSAASSMGGDKDRLRSEVSSTAFGVSKQDSGVGDNDWHMICVSTSVGGFRQHAYLLIWSSTAARNPIDGDRLFGGWRPGDHLPGNLRPEKWWDVDGVVAIHVVAWSLRQHRC